MRCFSRKILGTTQQDELYIRTETIKVLYCIKRLRGSFVVLVKGSIFQIYVPLNISFATQ